MGKIPVWVTRSVILRQKTDYKEDQAGSSSGLREKHDPVRKEGHVKKVARHIS